MTHFWVDALKAAIMVTQARIRIMEKQGNGIEAMKEKQVLKEQQERLKRETS